MWKKSQHRSAPEKPVRYASGQIFREEPEGVFKEDAIGNFFAEPFAHRTVKLLHIAGAANLGTQFAPVEVCADGNRFFAAEREKVLRVPQNSVDGTVAANKRRIKV